jgi:hypothetical protein
MRSGAKPEGFSWRPDGFWVRGDLNHASRCESGWVWMESGAESEGSKLWQFESGRPV